MFFDLLHFGSGTQAIHYFTLCLVSILGTIQIAAARYSLRHLVWIEGRAGVAAGLLAISLAFTWFFITDEEIFMPGLAGGELFTLFFAAFILSVPTSRTVAYILNRIRVSGPMPRQATRVKEPTI